MTAVSPTVKAESYTALQAAASAALSSLHAVGAPLTRIEQQSMLRAAQRATGLSNWGDEAFMAPMKHFAEVLAAAPLSGIGKVVIRQAFIRAVQNRLWLVDYLERHPEMAEVEVERPVFVLGFPRTGTTVLQNLLSLDRDRRALRFWEITNPVPRSEDRAEDERLRIGATDQMLTAAYFMAPEMGKVHYIDAHTPEECWPLFANSFAVMNWDLQTGIREMGDWLLDYDMVQPYREYKQQLQVMLAHEPADHLVLKCPEHLWFVDSLLTVFPDAHIVMTHRDPVDTIASYCSLISMQWRTLYGVYDPKVIGKHVQHRFLEGVNRAMAARAEANAPHQFYDVNFKHFVHNQGEVVRDIAGHFDLPWRPDADKQVQGWLDDRREDARGQHKYSYQRYGLDPDEVYEQFAHYIEAYGVHLRHNGESTDEQDARRMRKVG